MPDLQPIDVSDRVVLVTGAARRIGAVISRTLHEAGMRIAIHYRTSAADAAALGEELNDARAGSAKAFQADLVEEGGAEDLIDRIVDWSGTMDALVNNASTFYPTPLGEIDEKAWTDLIGSNLKAPLFVSQAAAPHLRAARGGIVNIVDIHADKPSRDPHV